MNLAVDMRGVTVRRGERLLLADVSLQIATDQRWVVLGPNGAGKTTLLSIMGARLFPTAGTVGVLDEELGACDLSEVTPRIGWASMALAEVIPPAETVSDVVLTGSRAVTGRWRDEYDDLDHQRVARLLADWGLESLSGRRFGTLSEGERKRSLIARALMPDPELLLLDEPGAGLDLGGREDLIGRLSSLAADPCAPTLVMVTHHLEEIPPGFTHALLLSAGEVIGAGAIDATLTGEQLSRTYGLPITVDQLEGRWTARYGLTRG